MDKKLAMKCSVHVTNLNRDHFYRLRVPDFDVFSNIAHCLWNSLHEFQYLSFLKCIILLQCSGLWAIREETTRLHITQYNAFHHRFREIGDRPAKNLEIFYDEISRLRLQLHLIRNFTRKLFCSHIFFDKS